MYENLKVGDLLVSRLDSSLWIIVKTAKRKKMKYGTSPPGMVTRLSYLLISHRGTKKWYEDIEVKVKFKIPK